MAMKIDRTLVHVAPGSERIMAENEVRAVYGEFRIGLDACPRCAGRDGYVVIVANDQVLLSMKRAHQVCNALCRLTDREVAEVPDFVAGFDHRIPSLDHRPIHLSHG